jgi:hypothetical protein
MFIATIRRRGLVRVGAALAIAAALSLSLTANPASAATSTGSAPKASVTGKPAGVPVPPVYRWANVNSELCLAYDVESRGAARQEGCIDSGPDFDYTIHWILQDGPGGTYQLINDHNNQCLTIPNSSKDNGASPFVYNCGGVGAQYFTLVPADPNVAPGAYEIVNTNSNKCVSVGGSQTNKGAWIIQWDCSTSRLDDLWYPRAA